MAEALALVWHDSRMTEPHDSTPEHQAPSQPAVGGGSRVAAVGEGMGGVKPVEGTPEHEHLLARLNRRRQRLWRRTKRTVRLVIGIPVVLALVVLGLSRSPLVGWVVKSQIQELTGAEFLSSRAIIELDGRLLIRDPVLRVPGVAGEAGEMLSARSASVELDWSGVLGGKVVPIGVRLEKPRVVLSQSKADGTLNAAVLAEGMTKEGAGRSVSGGFLPPEISLEDGRIVFGEHDQGGVLTVLDELRVDGGLIPVRSDRPVFAVALTQRPEDKSPVAERALVLEGRMDFAEGQGDVHLRNVTLESIDASKVPSAYRDIWRRLDMHGDLSRIDLHTKRDEGVSVELVLSGVSMSALVPAEAGGAEEATGASVPDLKLRGVAGTVRIAPSGVRAELEGRIDGQSGLSRVRLRTQGLTATSPLTCEIRGSRINVAKDPAFLSYVPRTVREYFEHFSGPTADVDVAAQISRPSPIDGKPSPIMVSGTLAFRNGAAAFHKFPYPFTDMSGVVRFDESRLQIDQIRGRGPTGASLKASGVISPLTDHARVDLSIAVERVPIDEHLLKAMPPDRREVTSLIFDRAEYERLLTANMIRRPNEMGVDGTRLAPPCPFAGDADITVRVEREIGPGSNWTTTVDAKFSELGVVARPFPLPVIGRDVKLRITDTEASIDQGKFVAPRGGAATVDARVVFFEDGERVVRPTMHVMAKDLPVDELLIRAARSNGSEESSDEVSGARAGGSFSDAVFDRVVLSGSVDCEVSVDGTRGASPEGGTPKAADMWYDLAIGLEGLRAQPLVNGEPGRLALGEFLGSMTLSPEKVHVENARARLIRTSGPLGPEPASMIVGPQLPAGEADAGHVALWLDSALSRSPEFGQLSTTVQLTGLHLDDGIEDVVQVVSPEAAAWLSEVRGEREPEGLIDAHVRAGRAAGGSERAPDVSVSLSRVREVSFDALGGRVGVDLGEGWVLLGVPPEGPATLRAAHVDAALSYNGENAGKARLDGLLTLDREKSSLVAPSDARAEARLWRFETPIVNAVLSHVGGEPAQRRFAQIAPRGVFDADVRVFTREGGATSEDMTPEVQGVIRPHTLAIVANGRDVEFERVEGAVSFASTPTPGGFEGCIDDVRVRAPEWTAEVDGRFSGAGIGESRSVTVDLALGVDAARADDALLALVPESARETMHTLEVVINGPVRLHDGRVFGSLDQENQPLRFKGVLEFEDASLEAGARVEQMSGSLDLDVATRGGELSDDVRIALLAPSLRYSGLSVRDLQMYGQSTGRAGEVDIDRIIATLHGGRVTGQAHIRPVRTSIGEGARPGESERQTYSVDAVAAGVAFAPLLEELSSIGVAEPLVGPMPDASRDPDVRRGRLDARLSLAGVTGDQRSRTGRGAVRVSHGDVLRLPVIFPLMQLSNLVLPSEEVLKSMEAEFHVAGNVVHVERVVTSGKTIALEGSGTIDLPTKGIDFRFNSRNNHPIPVISGVWEALRNEIVSTRITGTFGEPNIGSESFAGLRAWLSGETDKRPAGVWSEDELRSGELSDMGLMRSGGRTRRTFPPVTESAGAEPDHRDR